MGRRARTTTLISLGVAGAVSLASGSTAEAALILAATVGTVDVCAADNNAPCTFGTQLTDIDPTPGVLNLGAAAIDVGGLLVSGSLHTALVGSNNILSSSSLTVQNPTGAALLATAAVSATDFAGPSNLAFTTGSGTWVTAHGSTATLTWYNDPTNAQGGETPTDTPGILLNTFLDTAVGPVDSFANTAGPFAIEDEALFSMTLGFTLNMAPGGLLISRGQSVIKPQAAIPEPHVATLIGLGLVMLGRRLRRHA